MEPINFLLGLGKLSNHVSIVEIFDSGDVGESVIVGRVLSVSITKLNAGLLKCVCIVEEPPLHWSYKTENIINIFLRGEFAKLDLEIGVLVAVNPEKVSKSSKQTLQASVGFDEKNPGQIWIAGSSKLSAEPSTSGQQNTSAYILNEEFLSPILRWYNTSLSQDKTSYKCLRELDCDPVSSFNLLCKILKVKQLWGEDFVVRVTDGTLYKWPVLFFNGHSFNKVCLMDHQIHFTDILMMGIKNTIKPVKVNMFVKLYGVEVRKFETPAGVCHCFRTSGDPAMFKVLPPTHVLSCLVEKNLNILVKSKGSRNSRTDEQAPSTSRDCRLPKKGATFPASRSPEVRRKKSHTKVNKSGSSRDPFAAFRVSLATHDKCGSSRSPQSGRVQTSLNVADTKVGKVTSISKVQSLDGSSRAKSTSTHKKQNVKHQKYNASHTLLECIREKNLESDVPSTSNSRKRAIATLYEKSSLRRRLLHPAQQLSVGDDCGSVERPAKVACTDDATVSKESNSKGRFPTKKKSVPERRDMGTQTVEVVNTNKELKRTLNSKNNCPATNEDRGGTLRKSSDSVHSSDFVDSPNSSSTELDKDSSSIENFLVDPPLVSTANSSFGTKQVVQSECVSTPVKSPHTEREDGARVTEVTNVENVECSEECCSDELNLHISNDSGDGGPGPRDAVSQCEPYSCDQVFVQTLDIWHLP